MANINTHRKALAEALEKVDEARIAWDKAVREARKAWEDYLGAKSTKK